MANANLNELTIFELAPKIKSRDISPVEVTEAVLAQAARLTRAEALQRSLLALMNDPDRPFYAHPMFWAPFTVVGEGGAFIQTP